MRLRITRLSGTGGSSSGDDVALAFLEYTTASVSTFQIKTIGTVNYDVDWGDGSSDTGVTTSAKSHTYSSPGVYVIKITPAEGSTFRPEQYGTPDFATNLTKVDGTGGSQFATDVTKWLREHTSLTSVGAIDMSSVTIFQAAWRGCSGLTSFGLVNTSSGTNFNSTWLGCAGLTSFPLINSSSGTTFQSSWQECTGLTSFPLIDTSSGTSFSYTWQGCTGFTSFPSLNFSSATSLASTWRGCTGLTSFPSLDFSSATRFDYAWFGCNSLTTYPANQFDTTGTLVTNAFHNAFRDCALTAQSIENILTSLDTNGAQNITLAIQGGSNAAKTTWSTAANTAYTNLINKGWTISYNA